MWGDAREVGKSIFLPRKKEKNKILLCLGSLAGDRRVSEVRYYSPYLKGKEIEIHDTFLLNAHCLPGAVLKLLDDTYVVTVIVQLLSHVQLSCDAWTIAHQAPLSMAFPRQEYWSGLPCPSPGDLSGPGIESTSLESPSLAGGVFTAEPSGKPILLGD